MKDLCLDNYKTLLRDIREDLNMEKVPCVHKTEEPILLICQLSSDSTRFQSKPQQAFMFCKNLLSGSKTRMEMQMTWNNQNYFDKEEQIRAWHYLFPRIIATAIKMMWFWCKHRQIGGTDWRLLKQTVAYMGKNAKVIQ